MVNAVGAHSEHPVRLVHQARLVQLVPKALQALQEVQAKTVRQAQPVLQVPKVPMVHQANKARPVMPAKAPKLVKKAMPVPLAAKANRVQPVPTPTKEVRAKMEIQAQPVHQVSPDHPVAPEPKDPLADPVRKVNQARMLNIVLARTVPKKPKPRPRPRRKPKPKHKLVNNESMVNFKLLPLDIDSNFVITVYVICYYCFKFIRMQKYYF